MVVDVYLCPVPVYVNPADPRLRVNGPGACGGAAVFLPYNRRAFLAVPMWDTQEPQRPLTRKLVQIAGGPPPPTGGFYVILLDE